MSEQNAERFIAENTSDRRTVKLTPVTKRVSKARPPVPPSKPVPKSKKYTANDVKTKFTPGSPNYEPFPCALCNKDIRIPGKAVGDGNHYDIHVSEDDGKPLIRPEAWGDPRTDPKRPRRKK